MRLVLHFLTSRLLIAAMCVLCICRFVKLAYTSGRTAVHRLFRNRPVHQYMHTWLWSMWGQPRDTPFLAVCVYVHMWFGQLWTHIINIASYRHLLRARIRCHPLAPRQPSPLQSTPMLAPMHTRLAVLRHSRHARYQPHGSSSFHIHFLHISAIFFPSIHIPTITIDLAPCAAEYMCLRVGIAFSPCNFCCAQQRVVG